MPFQPPDHVRTILDNLPMKPGVYIMKNAKDKIIYIGKAKYLRNRVRSYFTQNADGQRK
ncbi:MAG: GIY-YIG nuclease family protein, partial [Anaerolineae bacterium]|nr:GIY-YIG nuclease family protein [Anaerolineae bacterium]